MKKRLIILFVLIFLLNLLYSQEFAIKAFATNLNDIKNEETENNCKEYLYKIWIPEKGEEVLFSFFISRESHGFLEGKLKIGYVAEKNAFWNGYEIMNMDPVDFIGKIENGKAECNFTDFEGNEGKLFIWFQSEAGLEAQIQFCNEDLAKEKVRETKKLAFRPYNLTDLEDSYIFNCSLETKLEPWGEVQFIGGKFDTGLKFYPIAFMTDIEGNILGNFNNSYPTGTEMSEVFVEDFNQDGKQDVKWICKFADPDVEDWNCIFFQREDGIFCGALPFAGASGNIENNN